MLQELLQLFRNAQGQSLSKEEIRAQLAISPALLDHMLLTLVRRGRLIEVRGDCQSCSACPLEKICAGVPPVTRTGYTLVR